MRIICFFSHYMFHSFYIYIFVCMKMVEIPSLYELACRAFNETDISDAEYEDAFTDAMSEGEKPILIILQVASKVDQIPYNSLHEGYHIFNPFIWRIAYMNEELFGLNGPVENHLGKHSQVAIIEDCWEDNWGSRLESPELCSYRGFTLYQGARVLYPTEIVRILNDLHSRDKEDGPIEEHWFEDAELPIVIIDRVPESWHHSKRQRRREDEKEDLYVCSLPREYLLDPAWKNGLLQEYERIEGEQMED